jgi:hypothetical protein
MIAISHQWAFETRRCSFSVYSNWSSSAIIFGPPSSKLVPLPLPGTDCGAALLTRWSTFFVCSFHSGHTICPYNWICNVIGPSCLTLAYFVLDPWLTRRFFFYHVS